MRTHTCTHKCSFASPVRRGLPTVERTEKMKTGEVWIIIHLTTAHTHYAHMHMQTPLCEIVRAPPRPEVMCR